MATPPVGGVPPLKYALSLLGRRDFSVYEMQSRLKVKGYSSEDVSQTIKRLKDLKLIDDQKYAESYVRDKMAIYKRGRYRLSLELRQKGIDKTVIDRALSLVGHDQEVEIARALLESRKKRWEGLSREKIYQRSVSLLQRQGFSSSVISSVL